MPFKDPKSPAAIASQKRRSMRYYQKHKEKADARKKKWLENNPTWFKEYNERDYVKQYNTIKNWKRIGIKSNNYEELYLLYISMDYCMLCNEEFDKRINKHLDHNHQTGEVRYICCRSCNKKLGA